MAIQVMASGEETMARDHGDSEVVYIDHVIPQAIVSSVDSSQSNRIHLSRPPTPIRNFQYSRPGPISKKGVRYRTGAPVPNRGSSTEFFVNTKILGEDFLLHMYLYS